MRTSPVTPAHRRSAVLPSSSFQLVACGGVALAQPLNPSLNRRMNVCPVTFRHVGFLCGLLAGVVPLLSAEEPAAKKTGEPKTAAGILVEMAAAYASLSSYMDNGVVLTHDTRKSSPDEIKFTTIFRRPQFFRFEWESHHPYEPLRHIVRRTVVWSNDKGAFRVFLGNFEERALERSIAGAAGVSRGAAHHIPRLLLPKQIDGFALSELVDATLVGEETFEGILCYRIDAKHPRGREYRLWLGKADLMLRRLYRPDATGADAEEIRRNIRVNAELPRDVFEVNPADFSKTP